MYQEDNNGGYKKKNKKKENKETPTLIYLFSLLQGFKHG